MFNTWEDYKARKQQEFGTGPKSQPAPRPRYEEYTKPEPIKEVVLEPVNPIRKKVEERWTVYKFTLPTKVSQKVATGFESKEEAKRFIEQRLIKKDNNGNVITKYLILDEIEYVIGYDVILESREEVDIYYNDPTLTTVGNDKDKVLERYMDVSPELEIIRDVRWIG